MPSAPAILLVVEDNPDDADLLKLAHESANSTSLLHIVRDGVHVLEYLLGSDSVAPATPQPRLVLLDLHMPGLNGFEVLERLRNDERTRALPVVIFSASDQPSDVLKAQQLGANGYVRKPVGFSKLCALLIELESKWLNTDGD